MTGRAWMVLAATVLTAGCGRGTAPPQSVSQAEAAEEAGFVDPPRVLAARRLDDGGVALSGKARPLASLRLASPDGRAFAAMADDAGAWSMQLPPLPGPALFGLSAEADHRRVQAEGYLAVLPSPGPAGTLLRAGAGARPVAPASGHTVITAVDIDAGGAAVLTGAAPTSASLTALVDGVTAGQAQAVAGIYQVSLSRALAPGAGRLTVRGPDREATVDLPAAAARPPRSGAFTAERFDRGWRIDWMTPGGGVQTTLVFAAESLAQ